MLMFFSTGRPRTNDFEIVRTEMASGVTVIVSLHQVEYAIGYCPRTIALRAGEIVFDGPSDVLTPQFLAELYGEESETLFLPGLAASNSRTQIPRAAGHIAPSALPQIVHA
jgi:phosphonate transport system ATP-binding protein